MRDFLGNKLKVGDEVVFVNAQQGMSIGSIKDTGVDFDSNEILVIETGWEHLAEIYLWPSEIIKVIKE